ncbi:hypothetical protein ACFIQF_03515 [Comamonas sp. J-3]|uniref:hypothetical protein n=1 Tax=Comamonas trifloxystrobinivorans TaxID=3350256 RepID=UPI00372B3B09
MKTVLRRLLKALGYLLGFFVLLALGFYAWLVIANWNDAPLSEDTKRALQYTPPTEEQLQDNGFLIISGLDAPFTADEEDAVAPAIALGRQRLTREIERHAWVQANPNTTEGMPPTIDGAKGGSDILPTALRCPPGEGDCFSWYQQKRASFEAQITHYRPLLQRANAAAQAKQFNNPLPFYLYADLPRYAWLMRTQELSLALATLQWLDGQPEKAAATVTQISVLRQRLAESSNNLVTSMIALAMHYQELRWLSNAADRIGPQTPASVTQQIDALLAPSPPTLHSALEGEKHFISSIYYSIRDSKSSGLFSSPWDDAPPWGERAMDRITGVGFLPNETINHAVKRMGDIQRIGDLPSHEQESAFSKYMSTNPTTQLASTRCSPCATKWVDV